jgi:pSer/pThr/pTyr-binding forkhead associated (FHA) protein
MPKSARLIPVAGPIAGHAEIVITGNRAVRIGRGQEAEFPVPVDPQISTIHVSLTTNDEGLVVIDQNSTNGTFINGRRVEKKIAFDGDEVRMGQSVWRVAIEKSMRRSDNVEFAPQRAYSDVPAARADDHWSPSRDNSPARSGSPREEYATPYSNRSVVGPSLELNSGDQKLIFHPNDRLTIGRTTAADIQFADLMMSSCHFLVYFEKGRWCIADCNSTNGLFCNGTRITKNELQSGDMVKAGQTVFDVKVCQPEGSSTIPNAPQSFADIPPARSFVPPERPIEPQRRVIESESLPHSGAANGSSFESEQPIRKSIHRSRKKVDESSKAHDAVLKQLTGNNYTFPLHNEQNVIIGSDSQADIVIRGDDSVAGKHLALMLTTGMLVIEDLQSQSGTYVDGERVTRSLVQDGSVIQIGDCKMLFSLSVQDDGTASRQTPPPIPAYNISDTPVAEYEELADAGIEADSRFVTSDIAQPEIEPEERPESPPPSSEPEIEPSKEPDSQPGYSSEPEVEPNLDPDTLPGEPSRPEIEPGTQPEPQLPPDIEPDVQPEWKPVPSTTPEIEPDSQPEIDPDVQPELEPKQSPEIVPGPDQGPSLNDLQQASIPYVEPIVEDPTSGVESAVAIPAPVVFDTPIASEVLVGSSQQENEDENINATPALQVMSTEPPVSVADVLEAPPSGSIDALLKGYTSIDTSAIEARKLNFGDPIHYATTLLPNGLQFYQGSAGDDPIEICRRLLHAVPGFLIDVEPIDFWQKLGEAAQEPEDWLMLASPDDASWMIPLMNKWSRDTIFLGFSRKDTSSVRQALLSVSKNKIGQQLSSLNPSRLVEFLRTAPAEDVVQFFSDFDAIFVEIKSSDLWGLFARPDFGKILKHLQLHHKDESS